MWPGIPRRTYAEDPAFEEWALLRKLLAWIDHCNHSERLLFNILSGLNRVERKGHRCLEMGKALEEPRCLEKCRPIFSELDARYHLDQADRYLAAAPPPVPP